MFDSHAHLDADFFGDDLNAVLSRAVEAGVTCLVNVGSSKDTCVMEHALDLAHRVRGIAMRAALGIHPHEADGATDEVFGHLERLLTDPFAVAVGEAGLDYHYTLSSRQSQARVFERQVRLAAEARIPLVVHCREAHEDCLKILRKFYPAPASGVIHCFAGEWDLAREYLALGLYVSIPGIVTFKNAGPLLETVRELPLDRMLVETDSPFLAPVPHRGKRNEPAYLVHTISAIARIRGCDPRDIERATTDNACRLFGFG